MGRYTFDDDFPLVPEGERTLVVASIKDAVARSGANMVVFMLRDKETGIEMKHQCMNEAEVAKGGRWKLKNTFSAILGYRLPKGDITIDDSQIIGKSLRAIVGRREFNGKTYAEIKEIFMPDQVSPGQTTISDDLEDMNKEELPF